MEQIITKEHKPLFPYEYSKSQRILGVEINGEIFIFSENALSSLSIQELYSTYPCLLYTSPSPRDGLLSRMPSSA